MNKIVEGLKKFPLSPFVLVLFVFIHAYNYSYKWIQIHDLVEPFLYTFFAVTIVFAILSKILKSSVKSGLITSVLILIFFYTGFVKDYVLKLTGSYLHLRYSLPIIIILLVVFLLRVRKLHPSRIIKLNYFFNLLFLIYISVDIGISGYHMLSMPKVNLELNSDLANKSISQEMTVQKPDVYFLVFDEYSSSVSLKENYGFNNSSLDSFLLAKGFFISTHSKSNYTYTIFSLASTLNLNYFKNAEELNFPDDFGLVWKYIYQNKVFETFKDEGYDIKNFSFFNIDEHPVTDQSFSKAWALKFLLDKSLFSVYNLVYLWIDRKHYTNLLEKKLADFNNEIIKKSDRPKFVYLHFLLPHHPYVFKSNGVERSVFEYTKKDFSSNSEYVNQLIFTNKVIKYVVAKIMASDNKKIIILEGDHGNRYYKHSDEKTRNKYYDLNNDFKNLNAYYFYDKNYSNLNDSISPVNSFRVVFDQYLNRHFNLLKDTAMF